jgi:hypothetical protein
MASLKKEESAAQSSDKSDESEGEENKAFLQKKNTKDKPKKHIWGKKAFFYFVTGTLLLAGFSLYPFLNPGKKTYGYPILNGLLSRIPHP